MKHAKIISIIFGVSAQVLLCAMCSFVAYLYCDMLWCSKYMMCSAPASVAFIFTVPFLVGVGICTALCLYFGRKSQKQAQEAEEQRTV